MKDNRFIELVNLYVDRQISADEMVTLEAEMQANPKRRAVYRQYCQMHRATTLVYESFRTDDSGQPADKLKAEAKVARFEPEYSGRRKHWTYYATGLAAACVALAFVRVGLTSNNSSAQNSVASIPSKQIQAPAAVIAQSPATLPAAATAAPAENPVTVRPGNLVAEQDYAAMLAAMRKEDQRAFASGQIQPSRTASLFEDGVFDSQPASSNRVFRNKQKNSQQTEFAAFQFQR